MWFKSDVAVAPDTAPAVHLYMLQLQVLCMGLLLCMLFCRGLLLLLYT